MGQSMRVIGRMICKKVMDVRFGVMELSILVITRKGRNIIMECMNGWMGVNMKGIGMIIR